MRARRATAAAAAAIALAGLVAGAGAAPAAAQGSSCVTGQLQPVPGGSTSLAGSTPVVFVHGIISTARMWKPTTPGSIAYQAARMSGITAWTFDYGPESLDWVSSTQAIGPNLATALSCLAGLSGRKVIVVAHSMGGLATQYAVAQPDRYGGTVGRHVAEVITIGTPYQGSEILTAVQLARLGVSAFPPPGEAGLVVLGDAVLAACAGHSSGICALPAVLDAPVGVDLLLHSPAIAHLPSWPASLPVLDIAGDMGLVVRVGDLISHRFDIGDVAVTVGSATAHSTAGPPDIKTCPAEDLLGAVHGDPGPCFHTHLVNDADVVAEVLAAIRGQAQPTAVVDTAPVSAAGQPSPGETITDHGAAQCEAGSDVAPQAYRCFSQNGVFDPCWLDNADPSQATVLCQLQPWSTQVIRFSVPADGLMSFFGPAQSVDLGYPWGVQLADGERCVAVQGTHDSFDGKVVDYGCGPASDHVLLRPLDRAASSWTYQSAYYHGTSYIPGPVEHVTTAWYASPDNGAALDDRQNDCTATALAFAAQAYEAAHSNPNGALPDINAQACDDGYAELVFTQTAPPPGYTATIAFKASPAGWQEIGSADFIEPGQFGMPVSVGKAINKELASTPQTEKVAF